MNIVCDGKFAKEFISSICSGLPLPGQKQDFSISGSAGLRFQCALSPPFKFSVQPSSIDNKIPGTFNKNLID